MLGVVYIYIHELQVSVMDGCVFRKCDIFSGRSYLTRLMTVQKQREFVNFGNNRIKYKKEKKKAKIKILFRFHQSQIEL